MADSNSSDITAMRRVIEYTRGLGDIEAQPLAEEFGRILIEENERRLPAGLDSDERPMPTTQRERSVTRSQRQGHGKPLNPRGVGGRAIRSFGVLEYARASNGDFKVTCGWRSFDSLDGRSIPEMHANPAPSARYPRRNIMGIGPTAVRKAREAAVVYYIRKSQYRGG